MKNIITIILVSMMLISTAQEAHTNKYFKKLTSKKSDKIEQFLVDNSFTKTNSIDNNLKKLLGVGWNHRIELYKKDNESIYIVYIDNKEIKYNDESNFNHHLLTYRLEDKLDKKQLRYRWYKNDNYYYMTYENNEYRTYVIRSKWGDLPFCIALNDVKRMINNE